MLDVEPKLKNCEQRLATRETMTLISLMENSGAIFVLSSSYGIESSKDRHVLLRDMNVSVEMHWTSRRAVNYAASAMKTESSLSPTI